MIFFRFISWWWSTLDPTGRVLIPGCFGAILSTALMLMEIITPLAWSLFILSMILSVIIGYVIFRIFFYFKNKWVEFNKIKDREAEEIVYRLKNGNKRSPEEILDIIRQKSKGPKSF